MLADPRDWMESLAPTVEQIRWLAALDSDLQSAQIELMLCLEAAGAAQSATGDTLHEKNLRTLHHAKGFVCAMRRFARVLENANLSQFPQELADVIKLQRRMKKSFFDTYTNPRNFVEHMAEEVNQVANEADVRGILLDTQRHTWHPVFEDLGLEQGTLVAGGERAEVNS